MARLARRARSLGEAVIHEAERKGAGSLRGAQSRAILAKEIERAVQVEREMCALAAKACAETDERDNGAAATMSAQMAVDAILARNEFVK